MGLLSKMEYWESKFQDRIAEQEESYPLGLGVVIHASLIKEASDLLPSPGSPEVSQFTAGNRENPVNQ